MTSNDLTFFQHHLFCLYVQGSLKRLSEEGSSGDCYSNRCDMKMNSTGVRVARMEGNGLTQEILRRPQRGYEGEKTPSLAKLKTNKK